MANAILPTFEALSDESLLSRCMHGGTQNQNETIIGLIWQRPTKETNWSLPTVETATFLGVSHFETMTLTTVDVATPKDESHALKMFIEGPVQSLSDLIS